MIFDSTNNTDIGSKYTEVFFISSLNEIFLFLNLRMSILYAPLV